MQASHALGGLESYMKPKLADAICEVGRGEIAFGKDGTIQRLIFFPRVVRRSPMKVRSGRETGPISHVEGGVFEPEPDETRPEVGKACWRDVQTRHPALGTYSLFTLHFRWLPALLYRLPSQRGNGYRHRLMPLSFAHPL